MTNSQSYHIQLEAFQGPLDLLLFLIRKKKIDIHDIPIATITKEYLDYLNQKEKINLEREAEFLLMASLLIYIKSQMLLPRENILDEEDDPRQVLVDRLQDYQKIKAACTIFREKEGFELKKWQRTVRPPFPEEDEMEFIEASLFDLSEAFFKIMEKKERENIKVIKGKEVSLDKKMSELMAILNKHLFIEFKEYFSRQETIEEALLSFFCLLELIKARIVIAIQERLFHSIKVWLRKEEPK
ncbi:segregation and condensation protein A [Acidobacteriota bacterium]